VKLKERNESHAAVKLEGGNEAAVKLGEGK
jgi:hypothetical protein